MKNGEMEQVQAIFPRSSKNFLKVHIRASLMVQWLRISLAMQETQVRSLVWEDPTSKRTTKPMHHNN